MTDIKYIYPHVPTSARTMPYLEVDGVKRTTEKAVCFDIDGDDLWIPKSIIKGNKDGKSVNLPHWFKFGGNNYNTFSKYVLTLPC